jgi:hypothetical protein
MTTKPLKKPIAQSVDSPLAAHLRAALLALPAELVQGGACEIVKRDGKTRGYVAFEAQPPCMYLSDGHGKLVRIPVASTGDVSKAVTALRKIDAAPSRDREGRE